MRQALEGYINYIGDDEAVQKVWAYAILVGSEELLLTAWKGVRRDLLDYTVTTDAVPSLEGAGTWMTTRNVQQAWRPRAACLMMQPAWP
jgi:hypothetical protein